MYQVVASDLDGTLLSPDHLDVYKRQLSEWIWGQGINKQVECLQVKQK